VNSGATHDGISGAGNVVGMLATIVGLGVPRLKLPGGVGAGRSGTDATELRLVADRCCCPMPMLQQTTTTLRYVSKQASKSIYKAR